MLHNLIPTVVHNLSAGPADPNKSPLYSSVQGPSVVIPQACCIHLYKLLHLCRRQPTYWTHFSIFPMLCSITYPPLLHWTSICISLVLAMVFSSLNHTSVLSLNMTWSHIYMCHVKAHSPVTLLSIYLSIKKLNYEWMSHWIIHVHPSAVNK